MKILLTLSAVLTFQWASAQTDSIAQPALTVASPDAGVNDKTSRDTYKIQPEKNAAHLEKIKQRSAIHKQKTIKKYKGRKADTTNAK